MTTDMEALIEGVKLDARNLMRSDPRVWHEALESALDKLLPAFWEASRAPQPTEAEWSCEQGCKAPSAVCLVDHRPAPQPTEDDADLPDPLQRIYWYSCDCDVRTKYCEEHHRRSITVGELLARRAPAEPAVQEPTMTAEGIPFVAVGDRWLAVYTAEKQAEALEQAAAAGAGYVVTAANRRYREGAEHADIYWKLALERAAQRLREHATNQVNGSAT